MALDPDFVADCPYGEGGLLLDEILEVDREGSRVRVRWPTHDDLPLTREQRAHPVRHPRHVSGGLMVHMTGMAGYAHAYYVFDLRHRDGWIGYGGRIHEANYLRLAPPGDPIEIEIRCTRHRRTPKKILGRYDIRLSQNGQLIYTGDQTALWMRVVEE
ncbi:MAG: hypothetical protein KC416_03675 [Myxococcales bacterium]|nr:hypothetical protein [Myxococcales bacterium]